MHLQGYTRFSPPHLRGAEQRLFVATAALRTNLPLIIILVSKSGAGGELGRQSLAPGAVTDGSAALLCLSRPADREAPGTHRSGARWSREQFVPHITELLQAEGVFLPSDPEKSPSEAKLFVLQDFCLLQPLR